MGVFVDINFPYVLKQMLQQFYILYIFTNPDIIYLTIEYKTPHKNIFERTWNNSQTGVKVFIHRCSRYSAVFRIITNISYLTTVQQGYNSNV